VARFYDVMDAAPDFAGIRALHPADLGPAREKLYLFLSGWLGGPQLYAQKFGHPMLRARHLHAAIGIAERDQWLACMSRAMAEVEIDEALRRELYNAFFKTADWMRNREG
jgi:hemoglobin